MQNEVISLAEMTARDKLYCLEKYIKVYVSSSPKLPQLLWTRCLVLCASLGNGEAQNGRERATGVAKKAITISGGEPQ